MLTYRFSKLLWMAVLLLFITACNKNKIKCTGDSEKDHTVANFNKVTVSDNFNVYITKGTSFAMKAKGCTENINDLKVAVESNILKIQYKSSKMHEEGLDIFITMPELAKLDASGAAKATINGMAGQIPAMQIVLSGASEGTVNGSATEMLFNLSGASKLEIIGTANVLTGDLSGASLLKSYGLVSKQTDINASGASEAYVTAQDKLYAEASGASTIRYKGNPPVIYTNTTGSSRVIKE